MANVKKKQPKQAKDVTVVAEIPAQTHTQSVAERTAAGKALRKECPRKGHAKWKPPVDRADPVDLLIENSKGRVEELVPIRYGHMMANPFAFFRVYCSDTSAPGVFEDIVTRTPVLSTSLPFE